MTIAELKAWLADNEIPDSFHITIATFRKLHAAIDEIQGIKLNSGGTSIQIEVYPDGWRPVSQGSTQILPTEPE